MHRSCRSGLALEAFLAALLLCAMPTQASAHGWRHGHGHHHHHHHHRGWSVGWWGPPVVVGLGPLAWGWHVPAHHCPHHAGHEAPEVYVERSSPAAEGYWYYCESEGGYYPRVPSCPEPWVRVPPVPE